MTTMAPLATVLLATLLPTSFLIIGLSILSTYLFLKLQASHTEERDLELCAQPTTQLPEPEPESEPQRVSSVLPPLPELTFSDASNPDWDNDVKYAFGGFNCVLVDYELEDIFMSPEEQLGAEKLLDELGYQGIPLPLLLGLLRRESTRWLTVVHICTSIALASTSFESESPDVFSLLPFPSEVYNELRNCFRALEGVKLCPEISATLSKVPWEIAEKYGGINKKVLENKMYKLGRLLLPLLKSKHTLYTPFGEYPYMKNRHSIPYVTQAFLDTVTLRLRMLGSRQKFEFKWDETTEMSVCFKPALYSHASPDGVLLDEPKLWWGCRILDVATDKVYYTSD